MKKKNVCVITLVCICIGLFSFLPTTQAGSMSEGKSKLLKLAEERIGQLSEAEEWLFKKVANGDIADYSDKRNENNDPNNAGKWGNERLIRGKCVEWLCTDKEAMELVTHKGIYVIGVRIDGEIGLRFEKITFPLIIQECAILSGIDLRHAEIQMLSLVGTHTGIIRADGLEVEGSILLRNVRAVGGVRLVGTTIGGQLSCKGGEFINPNGTALNCNSVKVSQSIYLDGGFRAKGEVDLVNATIGGQLECRSGEFIDPNGTALNVDGLKIMGSVFLRNGFKANGEVNLRGATIGGQLGCDDGEFINHNGTAINGDSLKITGNIFFRKGFKAEGKVNLVNAEIGGVLQWSGVESPEKIVLDLRFASVKTLWDEPNSWPTKGRLFLNEFKYDEIGDDAPKDYKTRIEWIRRQYDPENKKDFQFRPQPYEQLAVVLKKSGNEDDAKEVLVAKNEDRKKWGPKLTFSEFWWYRIFGPMIGYGYKPLISLYYIAGLIVFGWFLFWIGHRKNYILSISNDPPKFNSLVYSIDTFVPLVDLYQAKYWLPKSWFFRLCHWWLIAFGWILTTLFVVGLTGLVRT